MDNLQRSYLMGYDAGLWGEDEKNFPYAGTDYKWWIMGYEAGEKAKGNDRESRNNEQSERQRE